MKDQLEIWVVTKIEESPTEDKEKKVEKEQEKEQAKKKNKGKATVGEKRSGTTKLGCSPRKKTRVAKSTYQVVLHDDDFNTIADRVCDSMTKPITTYFWKEGCITLSRLLDSNHTPSYYIWIGFEFRGDYIF